MMTSKYDSGRNPWGLINYNFMMGAVQHLSSNLESFSTWKGKITKCLVQYICVERKASVVTDSDLDNTPKNLKN